MPERKAALRIVELRGRNPEIEQNAIDRGDVKARKHLAELGEGCVHDLEAAIDDIPACVNGCRITIQSDQPTFRTEPRENRPAVPAAPERAIDVNAVRAHVERSHSFLQQHRRVLQ